MAMTDDQVYADVLDCAAKLLAWKAVKLNSRNPMQADNLLRAASEAVILADQYRAQK